MYHCAIEFAGHEGHVEQAVEFLSIQECKERKAYSPENIGTNTSCCLLGNLKEHARAQGQAAGVSPRRNFVATRDACCEIFNGHTGGVDALKKIGCRLSNK